MARYEAWPNPDGHGWLLDVQADLLGDLNTRIVVPLMPVAVAPRPATRLNPVMQIHDDSFVMVTQFLSAMPVAVLQGAPVSLAAQSEAIMGALDLLLTGV